LHGVAASRDDRGSPAREDKETSMPRITVGTENDAAIEIHDNFYNVDTFAPERISDQAWQASFNTAAGCSPYATYACVDSWLTDFRGDLPKIDVPVLLVHGTEDRILPYASTAARLPALIDDLEFVTVEGGPHNIAWTHPEVVNKALLDFLAG
jgi:non-heme chloroperoxidase